MATKILTVEQDEMTLDLLLWRQFTAEVAGRVESTLEANRSIAEFGPILPVGTKVEVELPDAAATPQVVRVLRLWG